MSDEDVVVSPECLEESKIHATIILMGVAKWRATRIKSDKKRKWTDVVDVEGVRYVMILRNDGDGVDRVTGFRRAHHKK